MRPKSTGYGDEVTPLQALNITSIAVNDYLCDAVPLSLEIIQASHALIIIFFARYNQGGKNLYHRLCMQYHFIKLLHQGL